MTITDFMNAKNRLLADGWVHTHTTMNGGKGNYGMAFSKNGKQFYLNKDTINNLPEGI